MCVHCITVPNASVFPDLRDVALDPRELQRETGMRAQTTKQEKRVAFWLNRLVRSRTVVDCSMNTLSTLLSLRSCSTHLIITFSSYSGLLIIKKTRSACYSTYLLATRRRKSLPSLAFFAPCSRWSRGSGKLAAMSPKQDAFPVFFDVSPFDFPLVVLLWHESAPKEEKGWLPSTP